MSTQSPQQNKLVQWWVGLLNKLSTLAVQPAGISPEVAAAEQDAAASAKEDAKNRLKLVLMHDRTKLSPGLLESMRDELMQVISKYVEIDQTTLDLCLEQESNTIALVANISVVRSKEVAASS